MPACGLCQAEEETILYSDDSLRVILVDEPDFPGFCRVIWHAHVKEMTDLSPNDQQHLFNWIMRTERAVRSVVAPDKINLASLGNVVPHLHWHVIPRHHADSRFPDPIWAAARRPGTPQQLASLAEKLRAALARYNN